MKLQGYEAQAFTAWTNVSEDWSILSFKGVAAKSGLELAKVRRAVRGLARKGLVEFFRTSWTDEGVPNGAGYGLTKAGVALRNEADGTAR